MRPQIIAVNATSLSSGGGLAILNQFLAHIDDSSDYFIFVPISFTHPSSAKLNVHMIPIHAQSACKRIYWDWFGLKRWFVKRKQKCDVVFSLQNTSVRSFKECRQLIYLHQAIPLHAQAWSFFKKKERSLAFYKYFYPFFIFIFAHKKTLFIVQTPWMKKALCEKFKYAEDRVKVIPPTTSMRPSAETSTLNLQGDYQLFYPANGALFKNHQELIEALAPLKNEVNTYLYLTIHQHDHPELSTLIKKYQLQKQVIFLGPLLAEEVAQYYQACTTVVFPSVIESFGLPLLEAASFAKPLVVLDEAYAREVISAYPGAIFAPRNSPTCWKDAILHSFSLKDTLTPYVPTNQNVAWQEIFKLLKANS